MKVYVASSWRNKHQPMVVDALRSADIDVYDFRHPEEGDNGFHCSEIDKDWQSWKPEQYIEHLKHPIAESGFKKDIDALNSCDISVLVMPCGRSAHLEFGYNLGKGKPGAILLLEPCEPELMYKMSSRVFTKVDDLVWWILKEEEHMLKQCKNCKHYIEPGEFWDNPGCDIRKLPDCPDDGYSYFEKLEVA